MGHGRIKKGVPCPGTPIVKKGIAVDLHGTLVVPAAGKPQAQLVKEVAVSVLGKINESHESLSRRTRALRLSLEDKLQIGERSGLTYWSMVNMQIFGCGAEAAIEISRRLTTDASLYEMPADRRAFFTRLFEEKFPADRVTLMIASNSDAASVDALLRKIGMKKYFPDGSIFTPEMSGGSGKPSLQYSRGVLAMMNVSAPEALMIGNSGLHDLAFARLGVDVAWLRDPNEAIPGKMIKRLFGGFAKHILTINSLAEAWPKIDAAFVSRP